jgi:multidrug efflux system membrane fusion protein
MNNQPTAPGKNAPSVEPDHQISPPAQQHLLKEHNTPAGGKRHRGTWILILLVVVLAGVAFFIFRPRKPKPAPPPPVSITVTNVAKGDIDVSVTSLGSVTPVYAASMSPRVDGQVIAVNFIEGQMVNSNDLLVEIDPGPYQAALTEATGQLQRDKALLEGANVDLTRYRDAYEKRAVPKQQVDDQLALVHQDEGTVKYDQGQVASAQVNLNYCFIRAPFAGRVGLRLVDPGNIVHAADTNAIVVVAQLQPITIVFNVAEDYLPQIQQEMHAGGRKDRAVIGDETAPEIGEDPEPGQREMAVQAWDRAIENEIAAGKVLALNNLIDTSTGTIRIKAIFDNTNLTLFPNQFVNAKLIIKTLHDQSLIPTFAIQQSPDGAFVYLVTNAPNSTNQSVTMRTIVPGTVDGNTTAVTQGLEPGDVIALDNFNKLGEGVKVAARQPVEEGQPAHKHKGGHKKQTDDSKDSP